MLPPWPTPRRRPRLGQEQRCRANARIRAGSGDPPAGDAGPADHDAMRITIAGGGHDVSVEPEQVLAPPRGNGHDNKAELLEIPAFLRRG